MCFSATAIMSEIRTGHLEKLYFKKSARAQ